mmetsp:Transcript_47088/g.89918  ORF Transcript_47088/g.89918 Transcript_47088/m.89918 type:complete len:334 (+) Transcript_47088:1794-2795(+)
MQHVRRIHRRRGHALQHPRGFVVQPLEHVVHLRLVVHRGLQACVLVREDGRLPRPREHRSGGCLPRVKLHGVRLYHHLGHRPLHLVLLLAALQLVVQLLARQSGGVGGERARPEVHGRRSVLWRDSGLGGHHPLVLEDARSDGAEAEDKVPLLARQHDSLLVLQVEPPLAARSGPWEQTEARAAPAVEERGGAHVGHLASGVSGLAHRGVVEAQVGLMHHQARALDLFALLRLLRLQRRQPRVFRSARQVDTLLLYAVPSRRVVLLQKLLQLLQRHRLVDDVLEQVLVRLALHPKRLRVHRLDHLERVLPQLGLLRKVARVEPAFGLVPLLSS